MNKITWHIPGTDIREIENISFEDALQKSLCKAFDFDYNTDSILPLSIFMFYQLPSFPIFHRNKS